MSKKLRLFKGRSSKGIRGIDLSENDTVMSLSIFDNNKETQALIKKNGAKKKILINSYLSITENGYGKRTSYHDFRVTNRGGKGIIGIINSKETEM